MHSKIQYFEKQKKIYPKRTWGRYRKLKWVAMIVLLGIYYLAPFLRWDRGPHAPDQAILIDMPARKAYFFFIEIWPQEVYYLTAILIASAIALFLVTSLFGRVWCGYACPQTVWTDLFVWVERIIQGDRNNRMRIDKLPNTSWEKISKKFTTHVIWLIIGLFTGGAWVLYFNDAPSLMQDIMHFDVSDGTLGWIIALTFSTYLMAGFAREQVCTYMCPYARFQSAMFDKETLIISYDEKRGEPRTNFKDKKAGCGDCVDCSLCVQVCPQGIDIRKGLQMECIACGLCIDACNGVMEKLNLPKGLIRYDTERNIHRRLHGIREKFKLIRPRTIYYGVLLSLVGGVVLYNLITRSPLEISVIHDRNPLFVTLSDGKIRNGYELKILNKTHDDKKFAVELEGLENAEIKIQGSSEIASNNLEVFADSVGHFRVFVSSEKSNIESSRKNIKFVVKDNSNNITAKHKTMFVIGN
jgi:cytochrome c oxidase accessory protein FixG